MDNIVQPAHIPHSRLEDALAILLGTLMVSFGVIMLKQARPRVFNQLPVADVFWQRLFSH